MRKMLTALVLVLLVTTAASWGQHPSAGTTAFPLVNLNYDARSVAMGGASVAMPNGIAGVLSNPAAAAYIQGSQIMIGYRPILLDVWGGPLAFARATPNGVFAVNATGLSGGEIEEILEASDGTPIFTGAIARCNYVAGGISWARLVWETLALGASAKGMYNYIGTSTEAFKADAFAVDAGAQYRLMGDRLIYGMAVRNLGFMRRAYGYDEPFPLPLGMELGVSYVPRYVPTLRVALDLNKKRGDYLNFEPGAEIDVYQKFLFLRFGYSFSERDLEQGMKLLAGEQDPDYQKSNWSALSVGAGLTTKVDQMAVNVDMGLEMRTVLGPTAVISALVGF